MKIYRISQEFSIDPEIEQANRELRSIIKDFEQMYPGLDLWAYETEFKIQVDSIKLPKELRRQGLGSEIMKALQDFATKRGKPIVLHPEPERGYKKKLDDFYKGHGFVDNKGRNRDYQISSPFGRTMYWRPR
jgi:GNAT superfamily N-acetyltransferase